MQALNLKNKELISILNSFIDVLMSVDRTKYPYGPSGANSLPKTGELTAEYMCGNEYLNYMQNKKTTGFPEITMGVDLNQWKPPQKEVQDALKKLDEDVMSWSASRSMAVKMLYPKGGYMGWHHNANAAGKNLLLSWSKEGLGYFRYQDPITKEIVTMHDTPGWTAKVGYYGRFDEPDKIYWHCANAHNEERVTLGYIIPHDGLWADMVADIESE